MQQKVITYANIKYNFKHITDINTLTKEDITKFQKLYYTNQISKREYNIIIKIIKEIN